MKQLSNRLKKRVEQATVTITKKGGRGVLVPGGFILTAAHCIEFTCDGRMVLDRDRYIEEIETDRGKLKVIPYMVEPVCDIAVLGCLDSQLFFSEAEAYEEWYESVEPVPLCMRKWQYGDLKPFDAFIFTHEGIWIEGEAYHHSNYNYFFLKSTKPVTRGTSGSPIVNQQGELLGVVSNGSEYPLLGKSYFTGTHPRASYALPVWIREEIKKAIETRLRLDVRV